MWAAANDGARRRRRRVKQRRTCGGGGEVDRRDDAEKRTNDSDDADSGEDDSSSDDGERSTTESIHDEGQPSSSSHPCLARVENDAPHTTGGGIDPAVATDFHRQFEIRKRKPEKRKRKQIREEAPEAAIVRLTSSYNAAMTAVGALHRLSGQFCAFWKEEGVVGGGRALDGEASDAYNCEPPSNIGDVDDVSNVSEKEGNGDETNLESSQPRCDDSLREAYISLQRVSRAARLALEQSLLLDHVILAPIFFPERGNTVDNKQRKNIKNNQRNVNAAPEVTTSAWLDTWNHSSETSTARISPNARGVNSVFQAISMIRWNKLSTAHRKEIRKVSYLSLVNYADLLLCACHAPDAKNRKRDMLDRGAVPKLGVLEMFSTMVTPEQDELRTNEVSNSNNRLWSDESTERTVRLALAAYVDASELDPTDPTLWFKLACAARALGCQIHSSSPKSLRMFMGPPRSHRCLERVALERGLVCLPRGVPPNRLLLHAWKEMENWDRGQTVEEDFGCDSHVGMDTLDESLPQENDQPIELVLYLPKYSWATLGRILIRASREGVTYGHSLPGLPRHVWTTSCQFSDHDEFGSPLVDIRLAPLLAVPALVFGEICEFLEVPDVYRLACTCRTMSSELASARAKRMGERKQPVDSSLGKDDSSPVNETVEDAGKEEDIVDTCTTSGPKSTDNHVSPPRRGRVSKRVRSHMITTEKQAERKFKRSSVEYCLMAGTLSCTAQNPHYIELLKVDFDSEHLSVVAECMRAQHSLSRSLLEGSCMNSAGSLDVNKIARSSQLGHTNPFISQTSLNEFIRKWSRHNSGPKDLLEEFLLHVSLNARHVFDGAVAESLSSCLIDCFNMISTAERNTSLTPWYGTAFTPRYGGESSADLSAIAVNLLYAELVFKRCEFYDIGSREHQEDSDVLSFVVPNLLSLMPTTTRLDRSDGSRGTHIFEIQCRIFWLASSYFSWIGRCSNDASTSKIAEGFGLEYLDKVIELLSDESQQNDSEIMTPHLESSVRRGEHWRVLSAEVLSLYKEHLQSSSIVSRARQCFQDFQLELKGRIGSSSDEISLDSKANLVALGAELFERYNVEGKILTEAMDELLDDFILLNEDQFDPHVALSTGSIACPEERWGRIWFEIPPYKAKISESKAGSRPSIIQVLATSLMLSKERAPSVFFIYSKLASAALLLRAKKMLRSNEDNNESTELGDSPVAVSRATRNQLLIIVVNFFIDKMVDIVSSSTDQAEYHGTLEAYLVEDEFCGLISTSLHTLLTHPKHPIPNSSLQTQFLGSISQLVFKLRDCKGLSRLSLEKLEGVYFVALTKSLIRQKNDFADLTSSVHDKRTTKWHLQMISKAHLAFSTANDIAELLSLHPTRMSAGGSTNVSHLIKSLSGVGKVDSYALFAQFTEALIWFWGFLTSSYDASSSTENSVRQMLTCPIASAMIGLCGSPGVSIEGGKCGEEDRSDKSYLSFSDYFDSDDSVNCLFLAATEIDGGDDQRRTLLRKLVQCVQCVSLVFRSVNKKLIKQETACRLFPSSQHGPFLPLVVVRVLSAVSEGIFELFSENVWGEYPYGARECGSTIDRLAGQSQNNALYFSALDLTNVPFSLSLLGRAYSHLYGFSFSSIDSDTSKSFAPESISAAIHLFRCVKRVHHDNRKTTPSKAFETIELALPPEEESEVSKAIKAFLFDADKNGDTVNRTVAITSTDLPSGFPEWVFGAEDTSATADEHQNNIALVRRGIANELAKGTMANLHSGQQTPSDMDDQGLSGERELTQSHELSLYHKFRGVLADLCYNPKIIDRWIVLSECLGFKAEDICDRLVLVREPSSDFCLNSKVKREFPATLSLEELQTKQLEEYEESRSNWKPFLGKNLLLYMKYPWSNFSSLQICAQEIRSSITETNGCNKDKHDSDYLCWKEIETKFEEGNYASWANSWAGMFIMALRTMRVKALLVARYLAKNNQKGMHPSEVCEDLGTALYSELQFSTVYGYPVHPMTLYEKRCIAERSNFFFLEADELSSSCEYTQKCHVTAFELNFMIGKGYEKIASTLADEIYAPDSEGDVRTRLYESVMNKSMVNYSKALADALKAERSSGGADKTHTGGSSHGALECLYRLHASRFKVLLSAVRRAPSEHERAELESLRIASTMWFDKSNESSATGIRDKTWDALADCVEAFHHCRTEIPLFHRAAYRLAQAYNYAPLFNNPSCDLSVGSRQAVPAIKSYRIRGLSSSSANESADFAISKLFDKRRAQLCAVWVTTSAAPSPFEVLNDSIRKYDALRLKYIDAYLDCMRLSERKDRIEIVLNWTTTSNQDLAGFYEASAALRGGDPGKHIKQSLLSGNGFIANVKRNTSQALAEIVLRDLAHMKKNGIDDNGKMKLTAHFKLAHNLFQRLNSSCKEVVEFIRTVKPLPEAEALGKCYLSIQAGYRISAIDFSDMESETLCSILERATSTAKSMMHERKAISPKKRTKGK